MTEHTSRKVQLINKLRSTLLYTDSSQVKKNTYKLMTENIS